MKKAFTIIEVSILFVIFLIVALLVAPMSIDDTVLVRNISKWRSVQQDFQNIFYAMNVHEINDVAMNEKFKLIVANDVKTEIEPYKITYMNGNYPSNEYIFTKFYLTNGNSTLSYKYFDKPIDDAIGYLLFDVNGTALPNKWGKDVFGLKIYADKLEPFGKNYALEYQKKDCSKHGTGISCSNYYLIGNNF